MQPSQLSTESFTTYPLEARTFAAQHLSLLQQLPLPLAIIMLRELINYDWRFPAERDSLNTQFTWLQGLPIAGRHNILAEFSSLTLSSDIASSPWVQRPQQASEDMTAHLWATHQVDAFHTAASNYAAAWRKAVPETAPSVPRLCIVIFGKELKAPDYPLFRKLRPHGTYYPRIDPSSDIASVLKVISGRAEVDRTPYQHWFLTGSDVPAPITANITQVSWAGTAALRQAILQRMQRVINSPSQGPEQLRTLLAEMSPADLGMTAAADQLLTRFNITLFTEGSGTQIFSTTFTQWTAREILRRAQPSTLVTTFGARQRQLPMDELVAGGTKSIPDSTGSLIDADMGAFYTWVNQQRLSGADRSIFIAWSQAHNQAIAIGPGHTKGATAEPNVAIDQLLRI
jgi:hypothetical protein